MRKWRMTAVLMLVGAGLVVGVAYAQFPAQLPPQSAAQGFLVSNSRIEKQPRCYGRSTARAAAIRCRLATEGGPL
jgi:hypothetical protein